MNKPSPAMAVALTALLVALGGSAVAAQHYLITSPKQIAPKVRAALRGARGPAGPAGVAGTAGTAGAAGSPGAAGSAGSAGADGAPGPAASAMASTSSTSPAVSNLLGGDDVLDFNGANGSLSAPGGLFVMPFTGAIVVTAGVTMINDTTSTIDGDCHLARSDAGSTAATTTIGKGIHFEMLPKASGANPNFYYASVAMTARFTAAAGTYNLAVRCARNSGAGAAKLYEGAITAVATSA